MKSCEMQGVEKEAVTAAAIATFSGGVALAGIALANEETSAVGQWFLSSSDVIYVVGFAAQTGLSQP